MAITNPYGSLGPSPATVARVTPKVKPKTKTTNSSVRTGADPYNITPRDRAIVSKYLGSPMTSGQITSTAKGELDPIIKQITDSIRAQATATAADIAHCSQGLASSLAGVNFAAPYDPAISATSAVTDALRTALAGGGTNLAGDISSRLGSIGEPGVVGPVASGVAQAGVNAGAAQVAQGGNSLRDLIASRAAAQEYGLKLPGIALQQGQVDISKASLAADQSIADATTSILKDLPTIVQNLRSDNQSLRQNTLSALLDLAKARTSKQAVEAASKLKATTTAAPTAVVTYDSQGNPVSTTYVPHGAKVYHQPKPAAPKTGGAGGSAKGMGSAGGINAKQTYINQASGRVLAIGKAAGVTKTNPKTYQSQKVRAQVGSPTYYVAVHQAEAAAAPLLGVPANDPRLIAWVQQLLAPYFVSAPTPSPKKKVNQAQKRGFKAQTQGGLGTSAVQPPEAP